MHGPEGETKRASFPRDHTLSALLYIISLSLKGAQATTAQLYPYQDTFEFDQGQVTKNQPIAVLILLSESLGIY